jgi:hypothetical protein
MNKTLIIIITIIFLAGIILLVLLLTKKKSCPGDGTCSGHGTCDTKSGTCNCDPKYTGDYCDTVACDCSGVGTCDATGKCNCSGNYDGEKCEKCKDGWSGSNCTTKKCTDCSGNGTCGTDGKCACTTARWTGDNCELCSGVWSGAPECKGCGCKNGGTCNEDGSCTCIGNYEGGLCDKCDCSGNGDCDEIGVCKCFGNYDGTKCEKCKNGWSGDKCDVRRLVAVGLDSNTIAYSDDNGNNWTGLGNIFFKGFGGYSVAWNGKIFVAVGGSTDNTYSIVFSYDGKKWSKANEGVDPIFKNSYGFGIVWDGKIFISVASVSKKIIIAHSYDGIQWLSRISNIDSDIVQKIVYTDNTYVLIGSYRQIGFIYYQTSTTSDWSMANTNNELDAVLPIDLACKPGLFVTVGYSNNYAQHKIGYSNNGIEWQFTNTDLFTIINGLACNGDKFLAVGQGLSTIAFSRDGKIWSIVQNNIFTNVTTISWTGTNFIAFGYTEKQELISAYSDKDGNNWVISKKSPLFNQVNCIV